MKWQEVYWVLTLDDLISALARANNLSVAEKGLEALSAIGGQSTSQLKAIELLLPRFMNDGNPQLRETTADTAGALKLGDAGILHMLQDGLNDSDAQVRSKSAEALSNIAPLDPNIVNALSNRLNATDAPSALDALRSISDRAVHTKAFDLLPALEEAQMKLRPISAFLDPDKLGNFNYSLVTLENAAPSLSKTVCNLVYRNLNYLWWIPVYIAWLAYVFLSFCFRPTHLLTLSALIATIELPIPSWLGGIKVSTSYLLLIGFLKYHPRVLDQWVEQQIEIAESRFAALPTVVSRAVFVDIPVILEGKTIPCIRIAELSQIFDEKVTLIKVAGKGGSGKTSLALHIARLLMKKDRTQPWRILPVLLQPGMNEQTAHDESWFLSIVSRYLQTLCDLQNEIDNKFVDRLLRTKRILLILDGVSEMTATLRLRFGLDTPRFPANLLVLTTRDRENMGLVAETHVEVLEVAGNRLSSFLEAYLIAIGHRADFDDTEFFQICFELSQLAGDKSISVMIAKMFAEYTVRAKSELTSQGGIRFIPDIIFAYITSLNDSIKEGRINNERLLYLVSGIAWISLSADLTPRAASIDEIRRLIVGVSDDEIDYLDHRMRLIYKVGSLSNRVRFYLDPVAEYFAAMYVVKHPDALASVEHLLEASTELKYSGFCNILSETSHALLSDGEVIQKIDRFAMIRLT